MARKSKAVALMVGPDVVMETPAGTKQDRALVAAHTHQLTEITEAYGIGVPFELETYVAHAQGVVASMGNQAYELGRTLLVIKEHVAKGDFYTTLDRIGVADRFARKCMAAALKFAGSDGKAMLASRLNSSKLLELISEDDEALEQLAEGGTIAGASLDDIQRMTTRELREALREANAHAESVEKLLKKKSDRLNAMERRIEAPTKDELHEQCSELLRAFDGLVADLLEGARQAVDTIHAMKALAKERRTQVPDDLKARMLQNVDAVEASMHGVIKAAGR